MADCRVRRVGEARSNRKESNSYMQATRSCTHCSSSRILFGPHSVCFLFCLFSVCKGIVSRSDLGHTIDISGVHKYTAASHSLEDGEPTRLHFAALFMVHFVIDLPENVESQEVLVGLIVTRWFPIELDVMVPNRVMLSTDVVTVEHHHLNTF